MVGGEKTATNQSTGEPHTNVGSNDKKNAETLVVTNRNERSDPKRCEAPRNGARFLSAHCNIKNIIMICVPYMTPM